MSIPSQSNLFVSVSMMSIFVTVYSVLKNEIVKVEGPLNDSALSISS